MPILVATEREVVVIDVGRGTSASVQGRHCRHRLNGPFRRDRPRITCAGSRAIHSIRNDSGVAIEAGALVSTIDGGRTWRDRIPGGPWDTHELALDALRVSVGDGYFESDDGGSTWRSPSTGLDVGYLRSVAIDPAQPEIVVVSAASGPYSAYVAGRSDGRLYRRLARGPWERVRDGWPEEASTIAPLLCAGATAGELWAADERGAHRSDDGAESWRRVVSYATSPQHLRGFAVVQ